MPLYALSSAGMLGGFEGAETGKMAEKTKTPVDHWHETPAQRMQRIKTFNELLAATGGMDDRRRARVLMQAAESFSPTQLTKAYAIALAIDPEEPLRKQALGRLADCMSPMQLNRVTSLLVPNPASPPNVPPSPDAFAQAAHDSALNPDPAVERDIFESAFKGEIETPPAGATAGEVRWHNDGGQQVRFHRRAHLPIVLASGLIDKPVAVPWWNGLPLRLVE